jgi:hypothetical protein
MKGREDEWPRRGWRGERMNEGEGGVGWRMGWGGGDVTGVNIPGLV